MPRYRAVLLLALAAAAAACTREAASTVALTQALKAEYPGIRFEVQIAGAGHRLVIQVDSAAWRNYRLATSDLRSRGRPIARFAVQNYSDSMTPDSVRIDFVQERSGGFLWKNWASVSATYAAGELR